MNDPIVIVSAARTPIGGLLGDFSSLQARRLSLNCRGSLHIGSGADPLLAAAEVEA